MFSTCFQGEFVLKVEGPPGWKTGNYRYVCYTLCVREHCTAIRNWVTLYSTSHFPFDRAIWSEGDSRWRDWCLQPGGGYQLQVTRLLCPWSGEQQVTTNWLWLGSKWTVCKILSFMLFNIHVDPTTCISSQSHHVLIFLPGTCRWWVWGWRQGQGVWSYSWSRAAPLYTPQPLLRREGVCVCVCVCVCVWEREYTQVHTGLGEIVSTVRTIDSNGMLTSI